MYNHDRDSMNEKEFDIMLEKNISDIPLDDVVKEVTPWKKAMNQILIGISLDMFIFRFYALEYVLPLTAGILMLLGFLSLRKDNKWFKACMVIAIIKIIKAMSGLIMNATIFHGTLLDYSALMVLGISFAIMQFLLFYFFGKGLKEIQNKVGLTENYIGVFGLYMLYIFILILSTLFQNSSLFILVVIVAFIFILLNINKLSKKINDVGYAISVAKVIVPRWTIVTGILTILMIGITCGYMFFHSYPMDWQPVEETKDLEIERVKEDLIEMGFPENVLNDLLEEDIEDCDGALKVVVDVEDFNELQITGISVKLNREHDEWKVFHHFIWTENPGFYGTEAIQICPEYFTGGGWDFDSDISGYVRYDKDGLCYEAPYYVLSSDMYLPWRFDNVNYSGPYAAFSMPDEGENHRGYVSYTIAEAGNVNFVSQWIDYTHQKSWMQYPVLTAIDNQEYGRWNSNYAFETIQAFLEYAFNDNDETE